MNSKNKDLSIPTPETYDSKFDCSHNKIVPLPPYGEITPEMEAKQNEAFKKSVEGSYSLKNKQ